MSFLIDLDGRLFLGVEQSLHPPSAVFVVSNQPSPGVLASMRDEPLDKFKHYGAEVEKYSRRVVRPWRGDIPDSS